MLSPPPQSRARNTIIFRIAVLLAFPILIHFNWIMEVNCNPNNNKIRIYLSIIIIILRFMPISNLSRKLRCSTSNSNNKFSNINFNYKISKCLTIKQQEKPSILHLQLLIVQQHQQQHPNKYLTNNNNIPNINHNNFQPHLQ